MALDLRRAPGNMVTTMVLLSLLRRRRVGAPFDDSWDALPQLGMGQSVQVVRRDLHYFKGTFLSATDQRICLRNGKEEILLEREEVMSVGVRQTSKAFWSVVVGAALGASAAWSLGQFVGLGMGHGLPHSLILPFIVAATGAGALGALDCGYRPVFSARRSVSPIPARVRPPTLN